MPHLLHHKEILQWRHSQQSSMQKLIMSNPKVNTLNISDHMVKAEGQRRMRKSSWE